MSELLTQFVLAQSGAQQLVNLTCPECGTSFAEFRNVGLLGCPHDYDAFEKALVPLAESAELLLVAADLLGRGPQLFLVEPSTPGVQVKQDPGMGLRAASLGSVQVVVS